MITNEKEDMLFIKKARLDIYDMLQDDELSDEERENLKNADKRLESIFKKLKALKAIEKSYVGDDGCMTKLDKKIIKEIGIDVL